MRPGLTAPAFQLRGIDLVNQLIEHTRRLARKLRPTILDDLGLHEIEAQEQEERFAPHIETACFRIAQEALTNAARYAHAAHVSVSLAAAQGSLMLTVKDDGVGYDLARAMSPVERSKHFGLVSMSERAKIAGARLSCVFPVVER